MAFSAEAVSAEAHVQYLETFLATGFKALQQLSKLREQVTSDEQCGLLGLGPEKSGKLLAACVAETSLLSAVYWVLCAHSLLGQELEEALADQVVDLMKRCRRPAGGFAPHPGHEANLLSTLSAVQIALLLGRPEVLGDAQSLREIRQYFLSLQLGDGSFGCRQGAPEEGDCRFTYAALCGLELLERLPASTEEPGRQKLDDAARAVDWLLRCQNLDGGFGCRPDGECESHAGHTFCCLAGLTLAGGIGSLERRSRGRLVRWLASRQCAEGGLNGRPGKAADACYTWWTLASAELLLSSQGGDASLSSLFRLEDLRAFVNSCMAVSGGVAPHPDDDPDPFHTYFGLAGLSLVLHAGPSPGPEWLGQMSPLLALPVRRVPKRLSDDG
eukprot:TRINITY_DN94760_c0_g1_i1.p1 TRINITY_DN94760_c0_g1~~TRINITY_DN94760_c0_g1_i1.p1  ORF type:complete len:394 (-),score=86.82 TRINITY_DN94760_c0_g1_i1:15-1172(-)